MIEKFKEKLKNNGQSLKWFYDNKLMNPTDAAVYITYSGFTAQLNGYAPLSAVIKEKINKYMVG